MSSVGLGELVAMLMEMKTEINRRLGALEEEVATLKSEYDLEDDESCSLHVPVFSQGITPSTDYCDCTMDNNAEPKTSTGRRKSTNQDGKSLETCTRSSLPRTMHDSEDVDPSEGVDKLFFHGDDKKGRSKETEVVEQTEHDNECSDAAKK